MTVIQLAQKRVKKLLPCPELDALVAEKAFGWKDVHSHDGGLVAKKQDKAGRWRQAQVPSFSTNPRDAYVIEERMKQLGRTERYAQELSRITRAKKIPAEWATPEQRARAALKAVEK